MRSTPIVYALVNPMMSGGMSGTATAIIYGAGAILGYFAFLWHWWLIPVPVVIAIGCHAFFKYLYKQDIYVIKIYRVYSGVADWYQPWPREDLRGKGQRPRGFGRGVRS